MNIIKIYIFCFTNNAKDNLKTCFYGDTLPIFYISNKQKL